MNRILHKVRAELERSIELHGDWSDYSPFRMIDVIHTELKEADNAAFEGDYYGKHGVYNELSQVAATAIKGMLVLRNRKEAGNG